MYTKTTIITHYWSFAREKKIHDELNYIETSPFFSFFFYFLIFDHVIANEFALSNTDKCANARGRARTYTHVCVWGARERDFFHKMQTATCWILKCYYHKNRHFIEPIAYSICSWFEFLNFVGVLAFFFRIHSLLCYWKCCNSSCSMFIWLHSLKLILVFYS